MFEIPPDDAERFRTLLKLQPGEAIPDKYLRYYQGFLYMVQQDGHTGPVGVFHIAHCLLACGFKPELPDARPADVDWDRIKRGTRLEAKVGDEWLAGEFTFFGQHKVACIRFDRDGEVHEVPRFNCRLPGTVSQPPPKPKEPETADVFDALPETDWAKVEVDTEVQVTLDGDDFTGTFVRLANDGRVVVLVEGEEHTVHSTNVNAAAAAVA